MGKARKIKDIGMTAIIRRKQSILKKKKKRLQIGTNLQII